MIAAVTGYIAAKFGGSFPQVEFDIDDDGFVTSADPIFPPIGEIILQTIASAVIFYLLWKFAGPPIRKYYAERSARIQRELDEAEAAKAAAVAQATEIRTSLGDIEAERSRIRAEAEAQAEALLADGRARLEIEMAELQTRAEAELATVASRSGDELRSEIARHAARAVDIVVADTVDDAVQQRLIEDFISRVGAGRSPNGQSPNGHGSYGGKP
jgi:F-type H+-transporting ATPase subunit b